MNTESSTSGYHAMGVLEAGRDLDNFSGMEEEGIIERAKAEGSYLKAPNGAATNLSPTQWVQVRTKSFKNWFGDWQNYPEGASKVVDENGEPMVVYHGTDSEFFSFNHGKVKRNGFYFARDKDAVKRFNGGKYVVDAFLNIKKPLHRNYAPIISQKTMNNSDGVIADKISLNEEIATYVAFYPNQIKSATENIGEFSLGDDIRFRFIGETGVANLDRAEEATIRLDHLNVAREMESSGKTTRSIKMATGWERGADGKWRYEVEDGQVNKEVYLFHSFGDTYTCMLGELYNDDSLFDTYPQLGSVGIEFTSIGNAFGSFDGLTIKLDRGYITNGKLHPDVIIDIAKDRVVHLPLRSVLVHEVQHAIQYIEGFAAGGNPEYFRELDKLAGATEYDRNIYDFNRLVSGVIGSEPYTMLGEVLTAERFKGFRESLDDWQQETLSTLTRLYREMPKEVFMSNYNYSLEKVREGNMSPEQKYHRISGEVEARNVQSRMDMFPEDRRNSLATDTEDIARQDQIFICESLGMSAHYSEEELTVAIEELSSQLHVPVRILCDINEVKHDSVEIQKCMKGAKGWFDSTANEVVVVLSNTQDIADAKRTVLHEAVGHYGLRRLFGKDFDFFLDNVFRNASQDIQCKIEALAGKYNYSLCVATEEYLARLAERGFENEQEKTLWQKVTSAFVHMLRKAGVCLKFELTDKDLRYILWESKRSLSEQMYDNQNFGINLKNETMKKEKEVTQEVTEKVVEIPSEIKCVKLSEEQKVALSAGEKIAISGMPRKGGGTFAALVSWDPEKARPHYDFPESQEQERSPEFRMPHAIKGIELSKENKQRLQAGEKIFLTGMTAASGKLFDAYVYIDTKNKKLAFDFPEKPKQAQEFRMPKTVKGVELSQENKQKLESGEIIFLEGMTSAKGTLFSANVYVDREKGTLAFDFPEKEKNRQGKKEAVREAPLEKPIKKNGVRV